MMMCDKINAVRHLDGLATIEWGSGRLLLVRVEREHVPLSWTPLELPRFREARVRV